MLARSVCQQQRHVGMCRLRRGTVLCRGCRVLFVVCGGSVRSGCKRVRLSWVQRRELQYPGRVGVLIVCVWNVRSFGEQLVVCDVSSRAVHDTHGTVGVHGLWSWHVLPGRGNTVRELLRGTVQWRQRRRLPWLRCRLLLHVGLAVVHPVPRWSVQQRAERDELSVVPTRQLQHDRVRCVLPVRTGLDLHHRCGAVVHAVLRWHLCRDHGPDGVCQLHRGAVLWCRLVRLQQLPCRAVRRWCRGRLRRVCRWTVLHRRGSDVHQLQRRTVRPCHQRDLVSVVRSRQLQCRRLYRVQRVWPWHVHQRVQLLCVHPVRGRHVLHRRHCSLRELQRGAVQRPDCGVVHRVPDWAVRCRQRHAVLSDVPLRAVQQRLQLVVLLRVCRRAVLARWLDALCTVCRGAVQRGRRAGLHRVCDRDVCGVPGHGDVLVVPRGFVWKHDGSVVGCVHGQLLGRVLLHCGLVVGDGCSLLPGLVQLDRRGSVHPV